MYCHDPALHSSNMLEIKTITQKSSVDIQKSRQFGYVRFFFLQLQITFFLDIVCHLSGLWAYITKLPSSLVQHNMFGRPISLLILSQNTTSVLHTEHHTQDRSPNYLLWLIGQLFHQLSGTACDEF